MRGFLKIVSSQFCWRENYMHRGRFSTWTNKQSLICVVTMNRAPDLENSKAKNGYMVYNWERVGVGENTIQ